MASLSYFLQREFIRLCPAGWTAASERHLLNSEIEQVLGYQPQVDVVLEKNNGMRRLWVEFEVSRADPVANHAKFATSHLFQPQPSTDVFVSMISPHVTKGRRNLAANTIFLLRNIGMNAFQTILFPNIDRKEIKRINHLDSDAIQRESLDIQAELDRIFIISEACLSLPSQQIHFVGDILEVMLNVRSWNDNISTEQGQALWGKRTITYFVYDPRFKQFAPTKFCAYTVIYSPGSICKTAFYELSYSKMTIRDYSNIEASNTIFDGQKARVHLCKNLGMIQTENSVAKKSFDKWLKRHSGAITIHPNGPIFIFPPKWAIG